MPHCVFLLAQHVFPEVPRVPGPVLGDARVPKKSRPRSSTQKPHVFVTAPWGHALKEAAEASSEPEEAPILPLT